METEEILAKATPRPWGIEPETMDRHYKPNEIYGEFDTPNPKIVCSFAARPNDAANAVLVNLAVNSYEANRQTIKELREALTLILPMAESYMHAAPSHPYNAKLETARAALTNSVTKEQP